MSAPDIGIRAQILKAGEKQIAFAVTNVVTDAEGNPVADHQEDVIGISNLEDTFIDAFSKGGEGAGGAMHTMPGGADVVQHFTISRAEWEALKPYIGCEIGIVKIRVTDPALWSKVRDGSYPEVSIGGDGVREPL